MARRNNLVEFARFLFSVLVVGYHVQMTFENGVNFFENGALAVEFFFLISGYFLARSVEKINANETRKNACIETLRFMKNKIKGILPTHAVAIVAVIIVILVFDLSIAGNILLKGLPSIFLLQGGALWCNAYAEALIIPEWYLSSMLISMLFMFPIALLIRKKLKGPWVILILIGILAVPALAFGLPFGFNTDLVYFLRAWGEMCVGMFAFYLSAVIANHEFKKPAAITLKTVEIVGYFVPVVLGFIPLNANLQPVCMAVSVVGVFAAISITFAGKGVAVTNAKLNAVFGYLGSLSLAIYLFHPVIITLLEYAGGGLEIRAVYLIVFGAAVLSAIIYNAIVLLLKTVIKKFKNRNQPESAENS